MILITSIRQENYLNTLQFLIRWLLSLFILTVLSGCAHEVVMTPQREEAFYAKVLDTDEKILLHRGGNWTLTKEGKDIRCFIQNDAEIVLTDKRILLVNTCSSFNNLGPILKWNYGDITELVLLTSTSFGSQHPFLVKFLVEDEKNIPIAIKILIFPVWHADEVFSLIKEYIPKNIPTFSQDLVEHEKQKEDLYKSKCRERGLRMSECNKN